MNMLTLIAAVVCVAWLIIYLNEKHAKEYAAEVHKILEDNGCTISCLTTIRRYYKEGRHEASAADKIMEITGAKRRRRFVDKEDS
ncbi:hypothetical protein KAR91_08055 [Candidatus Pacearchaeota archaeon]|nr:hypothetical protein [Candidatus Pacearchaeota archaeon]